MPIRNFLWITDLHYEKPDTNYLDDLVEGDAHHNVFRDNAFRQLNSILELGGFEDWKLSFIAVGGDITSTGVKRGFTSFEEGALPRLRRLVPPEAICIVPGNHDVTWGLNPTDHGYFDTKFADFFRMVDVGGMSSCLFPKGELLDPGPRVAALNLIPPPLGRPWYIDDKQKVIVLNINSAIRCGERAQPMLDDVHSHLKPAGAPTTEDVMRNRDIKNYFIRDVAQVTEQQLYELNRLLSNLKEGLGPEWQSYLRVALLHHHVVHYSGQQTEFRGYEFLVDSPKLMDFLVGFEFDIVLTGHKHHGYQILHRWKSVVSEREMCIIGGPTVGGYPTGSPRGLRLVTVRDDRSERKVEIRDIPLSFAAAGNVRAAIHGAEPAEESIRTTFGSLLSRARDKEGFSYRQVVSITNLTEDGDAQRIVEFDDLNISKPDLDRARFHEIELVPTTTGYLRDLHASAMGESRLNTVVTVHPPLPEKEHRNWSRHTLSFYPPIPQDKDTGYRYSWLAVNAFAMDRLQFARLYGRDYEPMKNIEFTHYIPQDEDPIGELTVIVRFPKDYRPKNPRLRIARFDRKQSDPAKWEEDTETRDFLNKRRALRYYESINTVGLRVPVPTRRLSYGILWDLPDAHPREGYNRVRQMESRMLAHKELCLATIRGLLELARRDLVPDWKSDGIEGSLAAFRLDSEQKGIVEWAAAGQLKNGVEFEDLRLEGRTLKYGEGIAGRAFKANQIRLYIKPQLSNFVDPPEDEPPQTDLYEEDPGGKLRHQTLLSFPLHIPVSDEALKKSKKHSYQDHEPYGVFSIGTESREEESIAELQGWGKRALDLVLFHHAVNKAVYNQLSPVGFQAE